MKILNLVQGSPEWIADRLKHFTASEAPSMMDASKYMSRTELLLLKKTGNAKPVDKFTQSLFDKGHNAEDSARPFAEAELELEHFEEVKLLPIVASINVDGLNLLASYDGYCETPLALWEHKLFNKVLFENVLNSVLEPSHYWQLEHQALVAGANEVMFTCSDGTEGKSASMVYVSVPERREKLIAGWKQFAIDLKNHVVTAKEEKVVAQELQALPKLEVSLIGNVSNSNLVEYKSTALAFIQSVNTDLQSDQDFADAGKAIKFFSSGEKELEAVKERALSDTADIKLLFTTIDELKEEMRQKRLTLTKLAKTRKDEIRSTIAFKAKTEFSTLLATTSANLNGVQVTQVTADFDGVMKGKSTVDSLQNAVDTELSRVKIELSEISELVRTNLNSLTELAGEHKHLFNDYLTYIFKDNDDLTNLITSRITAHEQVEAERKAAERKRIEAAAKVKAESEAAAQLALKEHNIRVEERAKVEAEQAEANQKAMEAAQAKAKELTEQEVIGNHALNNHGSAKEVSQRLSERFKETPTSVGKEFAHTQQEVAPIKEPSLRDIQIFLQTLHGSTLSDFGYLFLSNNEQHEQEALGKIKAALNEFFTAKAA